MQCVIPAMTINNHRLNICASIAEGLPELSYTSICGKWHLYIIFYSS